MSPIRIETIKDKLMRLKETINFIEDVLNKSDEEILKDTPLYYGLEHMMQICIEIILDIGGHILSEKFKIAPDNYKEIIIKLGENGIIEENFAEAQEKMTGFRNLVVHDYDKVDKKQVLSYAREAPVIFRKFGEAFLKAIN